MDAPIPLPDLEAAINYWRTRSPSRGDESRLCPQAAALARPYALMILGHRHEIPPDELDPTAREAYRAYRQSISPAAAP